MENLDLLKWLMYVVTTLKEYFKTQLSAFLPTSASVTMATINYLIIQNISG